MEKENLESLYATVLKKMQSEELCEKDLCQEFIQLGLQISEIANCAHISDLAKRYAYLLSPLYRAESCEWSELVDEIKELRMDLYMASMSVDIDRFFNWQTHFVMGMNCLKIACSSVECENMTAIEAIEFVNYIRNCIDKLRTSLENWE